MAWIDDRLWCHEKFTDVTPSAAWLWVKSIAYSSGMGTGGRLTSGQQRLLGATTRTRAELIRAGLWDECGFRAEIVIHDWSEHNARRDARRQHDRERKRLARAKERETSAGQSTGTSLGTSNGQSAARPRVETVETVEKKNPPYPNPAVDVGEDASRHALIEAIQEGALVNDLSEW
jgi:hypothetical protein